MFVGITNSPRPYAWGSTTAIAGLLGYPASGEPEAELWLGAHAGAPATIIDPAQVGGALTLADWIAADPEQALGSNAVASFGARLPFLLKILAAAGPLSLQAHPSMRQARDGFDRENAAGLPLDAPERNYRDAFHKPELIVALSERFEALCGFRPRDSVAQIMAELRALDAASDTPQVGALDALESRLAGVGGVQAAVDWLLRDGRGGDSGEVAWLVERVVALAEHAAYLAEGGAHIGFAVEFETVRSLAASYPGDPGIVLSLLLNRISLTRGEALYLPAGNIHAYLSGLGIELMAASDNVLRGGLTPKHVDVDELLAVLDFTPGPVPLLMPSSRSTPGVTVYAPEIPDFELIQIEAGTDAALAAAAPAAPAPALPVPLRQFALTGPAIALCTAGGFLVAGAASSVVLKRGESVFITPDEGTLTFAGAGEVFLATVGN
ncbi:mannose-6-phosphate isomerase, class I [Glaciibacter psychrotolerans]|uniref:mannose-6-phosphate isomerase n=1 Tax=Glaciibacter psychrotolerans TaxID=670054 RepID=A0A7Z0J6S2_9MICO|nr:mannose-6-phosphate isomerase, class I [Leifsonia psychrotolerans]NYJ20228.1 mannose-6-phosphate isomerase [Leifsonia psychrotolerans]